MAQFANRHPAERKGMGLPEASQSLDRLGDSGIGRVRREAGAIGSAASGARKQTRRVLIKCESARSAWSAGAMSWVMVIWSPVRS